MEESPQTSQTTLPWISPVQASTFDAKDIIVNRKPKKPITNFFFCDSIIIDFLKKPLLEIFNIQLLQNSATQQKSVKSVQLGPQFL